MFTEKEITVLKELIKTHEDNYVRLLKSKKYKDTLGVLYNKIQDCAKQNGEEDCNDKTKIYFAIMNSYKRPSCKICGNTIPNKNVFSINQGFPEHCSKKCIYEDNDRKLKISETKKQLYGEDYGKEIGKKIKQSLNKRSISEKSETIKKIKKSKQEKYGDSNFNNRQKAFQTCIEKYGVISPMQNETIKMKSMENGSRSCIEKYGATSIFDSVFFKEKNYAWSEESRNKRIETLIKRYGVTNSFQIKEIRDRVKNLPKSKDEIELQNYIKSLLLNEEISFNNRKLIYPYEIDIFINKLNIAIEYNGAFWHSMESNRKDVKNHLLNKTLMCEKIGIKLIHIHDEQWEKEKDTIKQYLRYILGIEQTTNFNYYKKYENMLVVDRRYSNGREFLNEYFIRGYSNPTVEKIKRFDVPNCGYIIMEKIK